MKKILNLALTIMLILGLLGCVQQDPPVDAKSKAAEAVAASEVFKSLEITAQETFPTEISQPSEPSEEAAPTQRVDATDETETAEPLTTEPPQPESEPTNPPTTLPAETELPEAQPPATEPLEAKQPTTEPTGLSATEPAPNPTETPTEPPCTEPTELLQTEPTGCQHEWICVHQNEERHWKAGLVCDCGWVIYGDPDSLIALWNAHSASYPAAESLFEHGGYESMDE